MKNNNNHRNGREILTKEKGRKCSTKIMRTSVINVGCKGVIGLVPVVQQNTFSSFKESIYKKDDKPEANFTSWYSTHDNDTSLDNIPIDIIHLDMAEILEKETFTNWPVMEVSKRTRIFIFVFIVLLLFTFFINVIDKF